MNAPITLPAIVANPPVITTWISDLVMSFKYGRISSGASVWRTKNVNHHPLSVASVFTSSFNFKAKCCQIISVTSRLWSEYLPDKYIACNTQGLCGRRSHCYLHDPGDLEEHKPIARCHTDTAGHADFRWCASLNLSLPSEWPTAWSPNSKGSTSHCWRTQRLAKPVEEIKTS